MQKIKEYVEKIRVSYLLLAWRRREETRADVKITIQDMLYDNLPEPYDETECENRSKKVYMHVYDSYADEKQSVYV